MSLLKRLKAAVTPAPLPAPAQDSEPVERAVTLDNLFGQLDLYNYGYQLGGYFVTLYIDQGIIYALFNVVGNLYRSAIDFTPEGTATLGEAERVVQEFNPAPVGRSAMSIKRQADGSARFVMVAATAVINRVGQIDSTRLFDDMIKRAQATGRYPRIDFYHLGEANPMWEFGTVDTLCRDGYAYIASGTFDAGHPLTEAIVRAWEVDPTAWGASIEYYPILDSCEYIQVARGVEVCVFNAGFNTRIAILPETEAAALFTAIPHIEFKEQRAMNEQQKAALLRAFGGDAAAMEKFLAGVKGLNNDVTARDMIARAMATPEPAPAPVATTAQAQTETPAANEADQVLELDDEAIGAIVRSQAMTAAFTEALAPVMALLSGIQEKLNAQGTDIADLDEAAATIYERLEAVEATDEQKRSVWMADRPARQTYRVTHRAREARQDSGAGESLAAIAERGLAQINGS